MVKESLKVEDSLDERWSCRKLKMVLRKVLKKFELVVDGLEVGRI